MTSSIEYIGGLRTKATHLKSGNSLITDAPTDNQGKGESFSPTDMVATALGACMITIMGIRARDNNIDMDGADVAVEKIMASNPRRISEVRIEIKMPNKDYSPSEIQLLEDAARGCPVCRSLHPDTKVNLRFSWNN